MCRALSNLVTGVSLLLLAGVVLLWVRSYSRAEHFWMMYRHGGAELLRTDRGAFTLYHSRSREPNMQVKGRIGFEYGAGPLIGSHPSPGTYPVVRRWGPFSFAAVPRPKPPTPEQLAAARKAVAEFEAAIALPPPQDPPGRRRRMELEMSIYESQALLNGWWDKSNQTVVFPAWSAATVLLVPLVLKGVALKRRRRDLRRAAGLCPACGYDLRATPGQCPECGAKAPSGGGAAVAAGAGAERA